MSRKDVWYSPILTRALNKGHMRIACFLVQPYKRSAQKGQSKQHCMHVHQIKTKQVIASFFLHNPSTAALISCVPLRCELVLEWVKMNENSGFRFSLRFCLRKWTDFSYLKFSNIWTISRPVFITVHQKRHFWVQPVNAVCVCSKCLTWSYWCLLTILPLPLEMVCTDLIGITPKQKLP